MIKSEQYSAHNIGLKHTTQNTKVTMTRFYDASQFQCFFPTCKSSKLVIRTLWTCMSGFKYLGMTLTSAETALIENLLKCACLAGKTDPKNCFESFNIEENLLLRKQCAFENDSNNLLTIRGTGVFG